MGAGPQARGDVSRKRADVGSLRAGDTQTRIGRLVIEKLEAFDPHRPGQEHDRLPPAGCLRRAPSLHVDGRIGRGNLRERAKELRKHGLQCRGRRHGPFRSDGPFGIEGVRPAPESENGDILLVQRGGQGAEPGHAPGEDDQQPFGELVQGARVPHAGGTQAPFQKAERLEGGLPRGLVEKDDSFRQCWISRSFAATRKPFSIASSRWK